jgi:hypothetical protein
MIVRTNGLGRGPLNAKLQPMQYSIFGGGASYYTEDPAWYVDATGKSAATPAMVATLSSMPSNCDCNLPYCGLDPDGQTCFMLEFPFIGKTRNGCGSEVVQGQYGNPYRECVPIILQGGGLDFISPLLRIGLTLLTAWLAYEVVS